MLSNRAAGDSELCEKGSRGVNPGTPPAFCLERPSDPNTMGRVQEKNPRQKTQSCEGEGPPRPEFREAQQLRTDSESRYSEKKLQRAAERCPGACPWILSGTQQGKVFKTKHTTNTGELWAEKMLRGLAELGAARSRGGGGSFTECTQSIHRRDPKRARGAQVTLGKSYSGQNWKNWTNWQVTQVPTKHTWTLFKGRTHNPDTQQHANTMSTIQ